MLENGKAFIYAATEYYDDVYFKAIEDDSIIEVAEGDKNYDSVKGFTFMSNEVKNSLISFLDCWFANNSEHLKFCFYTNVNISKERNSDYVRGLNIKLPKEPIINLIIEEKYSSDLTLLDIIKKVLVDEYEKQYSERNEEGYLDQVKKMSDELWIDFLNKIDWKFSEENEEELKETLIQDIAKFSNDKRDLSGKEAYVISALLDELEQRQNSKDLFSRFITETMVKLVMMEIATNQRKISDPIYKIWESLEPPSDKRNLKEKILAVCPNFTEKIIEIYSRRVGIIRAEYSKLTNEDRGAFQCRVFDICDEIIFKNLRNIGEQEITEEVIELWIDNLKKSSEGHLKEVSRDFYYPIENKNSIEGAILELFDSCYLSFDNGGEKR